MPLAKCLRLPDHLLEGSRRGEAEVARVLPCRSDAGALKKAGKYPGPFMLTLFESRRDQRHSTLVIS